jgi:hypothetical protein
VISKFRLLVASSVLLLLACSQHGPGDGATGGSSSSGGTGGAHATGGSGTGGSATGGSSATGGAGVGGAASGGSGGTGGATGGAGGGSKGGANGGAGGGMGKAAAAGATQCSFPSDWKPGSPTYTTYTLPNALTACGYSGSNNNIKNIVNATYFAAIPGMSSSNFNTSSRCGACVQIGNAVVTIVDECPYDGNNNPPCKSNPSGHLDLSNSGASAGGVRGDPNVHNQNAWKFVPCPINGNVKVRLKMGNNNEFFIENEILPIASVMCGTQTGSRTSYGAWHFSDDVNGGTCTATDISARSIDFTVGTMQGQDVDVGVQFSKCL